MEGAGQRSVGEPHKQLQPTRLNCGVSNDQRRSVDRARGLGPRKPVANQMALALDIVERR
jgi:hypothetical protein